MRLALVLAMLMLTSCELPDWVAGPKKEIKRAPGERLDVVSARGAVKPDDAAAETVIDVPEKQSNDQWLSRNEAMANPHLALSNLKRHESASIGDGNAFTRVLAPAPVVVDGLVLAMDAAGVISAHDAKDIDTVRWVSFAGEEEHSDDVLGGGFAVNGSTVFATTGFGRLMALELKTGKLLWKINVGAPVRGAPAAKGDMVVVLTADGQTLAFDAASGALRWDHRGIRESAGYFSPASPIISDDGIVVTAYPSGEMFAIRAETGSVLWSDTLSSANRTSAAAVFSGIDADPIVQDGVVVATTAGGSIQASALLNGRPLWQQRVGGHMTPWSAGNAIFMLTANHELVALLKRDGLVRWAVPLAQQNDRGKDVTPTLLGPILAGDALILLRGDGWLMRFSPSDGARLADTELREGMISPPVVVNGALYVIDKEARLHKYSE